MISGQNQLVKYTDQRSYITSCDLGHPKDQDHKLELSRREIKDRVLVPLLKMVSINLHAG